MPTQATFTAQYGAADGASSSQASSSVTITAFVDDGVISVGNSVTVTGLDPSVATDSAIFDMGTAFYIGTVSFNGEILYLFTNDSFLGSSDQILALTDEPVASMFTRLLFENFSGFTNFTILGTDPACFLEGTLISTPAGPRPVEALAVGDMVLTAADRAVPIRFNHRQGLKAAFSADALVRIRAGALDDYLPERDLIVTADHAIVVDGYLINASALVNGGTIDFVSMATLPDSFTVYHIETEAHDVILANGAPAETFIDYAGRQAFDNYDEYLALYGAERIIREMPRPRISSARLVPQSVREQLHSGSRAATKGAKVA